MTIIDAQARRSRRDSGQTTIEVGHAETRSGIIVELGTPSDEVTRLQLRALLERSFDLAARAPHRLVTDPGWWAAMICAQAIIDGMRASIQRASAPGAVHAIMVVERGGLLVEHPLWPLVRLEPDGKWLDLRGELALAHGPADSELELYDYGATGQVRHEGPTVPVGDLRRAFEMGVLEWDSKQPQYGGRRRIRAAK